MVSKMSSAYSDDGQRHRVRRGDDLNPSIVEIIPIPEPDTGVSITAQLSEHHHRVRAERPDEEDPIHEQPNESENASSPPGSIGEQHDIMSENIKLKQLHKFGKFHNKPFTVKQTAAHDSGDDVSKEVHDSEVTNLVAPIAVVSPPLPVPETSRSIQTYAKIYDKIYAEFKEELVQEYAQMRGCYMSEYQENYEQNTSRKEDKIADMKRAI